MDLGIDIGTYSDNVRSNSRYFKNHIEIDPIRYLHDNNHVKFSRLRIWVDPFDENGKPYGAGTNDYEETLRLARLSINYGYQLVLDFHYSDFWADPGKQTLPKAWANLTFEELTQKVYDYTKETLTKFKQLNIDFYAIQIGNEITNGFMWPHGRLIEQKDTPIRTNYDAFCTLLSQGIKAQKEIYPEAKTIIHLERSGDHRVYDEFFGELVRHNIEWDVIGASYYPYWHGTFDEFFDNMSKLQDKYHKECMVMEFAYAFTKEDYIVDTNNQLITRNMELYYPYPLTPEGQKQCICNFLQRCKETHISAVFYWEPIWIPGTYTEWATQEGQKYIHEEGKSTRNEWANQCLFDYDGNALPGLDCFK